MFYITYGHSNKRERERGREREGKRESETERERKSGRKKERGGERKRGRILKSKVFLNRGTQLKYSRGRGTCSWKVLKATHIQPEKKLYRPYMRI